MVEKEDYLKAISGCSKGIVKCDLEYKRRLKTARNQYKLKNAAFIDSSGKMIRPVPCKICQASREFAKACEIQYENHFYGYAKESTSCRNVYLHWTNNWHPNCGTSKSTKDGRLVSYGVPDRNAYDDLFRLSAKPDNGKVKTPKVDEFISGYIEENTYGPYKGRLQWKKWFRHSLTFCNWTKLVKTTLENKAMECLVNQPKMMIAKMIYDQNKLIPELDNTPKTPWNCEPISHEHWILASLTMVAFLGIRPKNRNIFENYGGISNVGKMNYFTFLENIDNCEELIRLSSKQEIVQPVENLRMYPADLTNKKNDQDFWNNVSKTFRNLPFAKNEQRSLGYRKGLIDYNRYKDDQNVDHLPYHSAAPYYNSAHGYDPRRYLNFEQIVPIPSAMPYYDKYYDNYYANEMIQQAYPPFAQVSQIPYVQNASQGYETSNASRKRSSSSRSDSSDIEHGLRELRSVNKYPRKISRHRSRYAEDLREIILADVKRQSERDRKERKDKRYMRRLRKESRRRRYESSSSSDSSDESSSYERERRPLRCRQDSGREDNGVKSPRSVASTVSSFDQMPPQQYPTYEDLAERVRAMEAEAQEKKIEAEQIEDAIKRRADGKKNSKHETSRNARWKTASSDSDEE
tara:strand:- start:3206 stop:5101 length:1896 start_codon:yes stop_codon:yes gene_type:complete